MALNISSYVKPGVYIGEVLVPGSVAITSERVACLVGIAPRTKRTSDEAVIRGKVFDETLSGWVSATSYYEAETTNICNRDRNNSVLYKNDNAMALGNWSFRPAYVRGLAIVGTIATTTAHRVALSLDGKAAIEIDVTAGAATSVATIATDINTALSASGVYGAAYASVASTITTSNPNDTLVLTSPTSTTASDIVLYFPFEVAATHTSLMGTLFGVGANLGMIAAPTAGTASRANTIVRVVNAEYSATATYTIDYVTVETLTDPLTNATSDTPLSDIVRVGSFPGASNYTINTDYEKSTNYIDWYIAGTTAQATFTGADGTFNVTATAEDIKFAINGRDPITITLTNGAARTNSQVAGEINDALNSSSDYGPEFAYVASTSGAAVVLTVPDNLPNFTESRGSSSSITFYAPTSNSAMNLIFGLASSALPYVDYGVGAEPSFGTVYYATYDFTRDDTEYDTPYRVYNPTDLYNFTSPITDTNYTVNKLAIAGELAFQNGAPSLFLQLVNDSTVPGTPTTNQIKTAIDNCANKSDITDVVLVEASSAEEEVSAYLMSHVANQSSFINKNYRRGWYGMVSGTDIGDPDTPDTFVYRATRTLNPGSTSPGRGRNILCAPATISRTQTLDDGSEVDIDLDSTYISAAVAGLFTSLPSVSDALVNRQIVGFNTSDFETYTNAEFGNLASNGVLVADMSAGVIRLTDPVTTEAGGGGVVHFEEPQGSAMKDSVTRAVDSVLYNNVVGVVPNDLTDFITDIKSWIANALRSKINDGSIGAYRDSAGIVRDIDLISDIKVAQSSTDPRTFTFQYWYNLKYPGKRFFGEYSVDNPFFSVG